MDVEQNGSEAMYQDNQDTKDVADTEIVDQDRSIDTEGNGDPDLRKRYESIKKELIEVGGPERSDDKIEITDGALDGKFAEFLLKNESCLTTLKTYIKNIKKDGLDKRAGKSLKDLDKFLDDIGDAKRMKKDYDEFMEKIQKPKKLNSMGSREIRRLNIYLGMHEDEALEAYKAMKPLYGKYYENKMKSEDRRFFNEIWENLKSHYANNSKFFEVDFGVSSVKSKEDLYNLAGTLGTKQWDGRYLSEGDVTIGENCISSKEAIISFFNENNKVRIDEIEKGTISIINEIKDQLGIKGGKVVIKDSGAEVTPDSLLNLLKSKELFNNLPVVENEWNTDHLKNMLTKIINGEEIKTNLENLDQPENPTEDETNPDDTTEDETNPEIPSTTNYEAPKDSFKIKSTELKNKIKELGFYDGNEGGESIKFDISKIKEYLEGLKEKSRKELEHPSSPVDKGVWTVSIQIALNYLAEKDGKSNYNVGGIDGVRGNETIRGVKAFQEDNGLKFKGGQPDGLPGKVTIGKLLEVLGSDSSNQGNDKDEEEKDDEPEENSTIKGKIESFNINNPVLDLSELSSLSEKDADQILQGIRRKINGQNLQRPMLLKLNGLSSMDNKVAEKLSKFEGGITIDKILNSINFDNCDSEIAMLKTLAPETNKKIKIIAPSQEICNKLKEKGVNNTEVMRTQ